VFEKRVQRRIFGPKRDEVTGVWKTLHNEEHDLYSPNIIWVSKIEKKETGGEWSTYGGKKRCIQEFGGET
jgi:hypothetical protein